LEEYLMKITRLGFIILLCLPFIAIATPSGAGEGVRILVKIPHEFTVGDQSLPAGRYSVSCSSKEPMELHLHYNTGEACAHVSVITRLSQHVHDEDSEPRMVFDRVGGKHILSEVWLSGEDGYLVYGTPKKHSHEIVHFGS
jgi:hypothetical protein